VVNHIRKRAHSRARTYARGTSDTRTLRRLVVFERIPNRARYEYLYIRFNNKRIPNRLDGGACTALGYCVRHVHKGRLSETRAVGSRPFSRPVRIRHGGGPRTTGEHRLTFISRFVFHRYWKTRRTAVSEARSSSATRGTNSSARTTARRPITTGRIPSRSR